MSTYAVARGPLAPLASRAFRCLWCAGLFAQIAMWMHTAAAQWQLADGPSSAALVAYVTAAISIPVVFLGLPAGVLADHVERRTFMLWVNVVGVLVSAGIAAVSVVGSLGAVTLLVSTVLVGSCNAVTQPPMYSLASEIVPHGHVTAAAALSSLAINVGRVAGPALAGFAIARAGVTLVFALDTVISLGVVVTLARMERYPSRHAQRPPFIPALLSGIRYVFVHQQARRTVLRSTWYTGSVISVMALLPLVARNQLHLGAGGYGVLYAMLGLGTIAGSLCLSSLMSVLSPNRITIAVVVVETIAAVVIPGLRSAAAALPILFLVGIGWTTMNASLFALTFAWENTHRARGIAIYTLSFYLGQTLGSFALGHVAQSFGVPSAFYTSAGLLVIGGVVCFLFPVEAPVRGRQETGRAEPTSPTDGVTQAEG